VALTAVPQSGEIRFPVERHPPLFTRGPRALQAALYRSAHPQPPWQVPPVDWPGTLPEWATWWALLQEGERPEPPYYGEPPTGGWGSPTFSYQSSLAGGRLEYGGIVVDFDLLYTDIALNVQGLYRHYFQSTALRQLMLRQRDRLAQLGKRVIFLDEDQLADDPRALVHDALLGIDHSRAETMAL